MLIVTTNSGLGYGSVVECLSGMGKALVLIPRLAETKQKTNSNYTKKCKGKGEKSPKTSPSRGSTINIVVNTFIFLC
jgi:hypothetical protein